MPALVDTPRRYRPNLPRRSRRSESAVTGGRFPSDGVVAFRRTTHSTTWRPSWISPSERAQAQVVGHLLQLR
jgi:hypothetical protein